MDCETLDDRTAVADYICDLTAELALLAAWADHIDLARILEMARLESEQICGRTQNGVEQPARGAAAGDMANRMAGGPASEMARDVATDMAVARDTEDGAFESTNVIRLSTLRAAHR
jgi:hypothetical protein